MYEICVRPLTAAEKDIFYGYHRRICRVWGISERLLPADWQSFRYRCYRMFHSQQLTVTDAARDMSTFLMRPPTWERLMGFYTLEMVTSVLLPAHIRHQYRLRYGHLQVWGTVAFFASLKMFYTLLPRSFRSFTSYSRWQQRVTHAPSLPLLSRISAGAANLFLRLYFGRHSSTKPLTPLHSANTTVSINSIDDINGTMTNGHTPHGSSSDDTQASAA
jgi:hypothetical protein